MDFMDIYQQKWSFKKMSVELSISEAPSPSKVLKTDCSSGVIFFLSCVPTLLQKLATVFKLRDICNFVQGHGAF